MSREHQDCVYMQAKRGDSDLKALQETLKSANEMDAMFLEEMKQSIPHFRQLRSESTSHCSLPVCLALSHTLPNDTVSIPTVGKVVENGNELLKKQWENFVSSEHTCTRCALLPLLPELLTLDTHA